MIRITDILDKTQAYLSQDEQELIEKAYVFSAAVHRGQLRLSGEPYLTHPLEVAGILAEMRLDAATIATGLLHDTVEDTLVNLEQIESAFGRDVAQLVDGVTKIGKIMYASEEERQAENYRKMIMAMAHDIRVLLVRLADRVHNMRTLEYHPPEKQKAIARETMEIHAPLANRLGINWMKTELEDLAFYYLDREAYNYIASRVASKQVQREQYMTEVKGIIAEEMAKAGLRATVEGRAKHFYSIYTKMKNQKIDFDEVYDLIAFRIILESNIEKECYEALSVIHHLWKPIPHRFKDRIAMPKANGYQSLHTTVIGPYGERMEVQIRTRSMHQWAEEGIAAHWRYKEKKTFPGPDDEQIKRVRELIEIQLESDSPREFLANLKMALFPDEVYVFTPKGEVKSFPRGATPIDFAYSIHTEVGHQCIGARVNRSLVPLKYELRNGDMVEIITQAGHRPGKDWLKWCVTTRARSKIKAFLKEEERRKSIELGREILEKELKKHRLKLSQILKADEIKKIYEENKISSPEELMSLVGFGRLSAKHVAHHFLPEEERAKVTSAAVEKKRKVPTELGISITGVEDVMIKLARCCSPIPGEEVVGYISRGRGITVHTKNCVNVLEVDPERLIDVNWCARPGQTFPVVLRVICQDRKGILAEVSTAISSLDVNIAHAEVNTTADLKAICVFQVDIQDLNQLNQIIAAIKGLRSVLFVERLYKRS
ncbi:MAG: bifunctional (p)ppGpp synthetase/guanosine-3',5'-bis(diphosphate) 3'-pyrophosphohydrolase [Syntrophales bacterium]|nr:bifunctional (p)ppGpp synthetase/guanosine-3',5'-bis(diphosphate) 3'-pyrophosphohydrolase [Syntrophales bacterium]